MSSFFGHRQQRSATAKVSPIGFLAGGVIAIVLGIVMTVIGIQHENAYAADKDCVASISVDTPEHTGGKQCDVYVGKVTKAYSKIEESTRRDSSGNTHRETTTKYHVVVATDSGAKVIDMDLGEDESEVYTHAQQNVGTKAVVETIDDQPAMLATSAGMTETVSGKPGFLKWAGIGVGVVGMLAVLFGVFTFLRNRGGV